MQTELLIEGMDGEACADTVTKLLSEIAGVSDVRVSLLDRRARVQIDESLTSPLLLTRKLTQAGYPAGAEAVAAPAAAGGCCGGCCGG